MIRTSESNSPLVGTDFLSGGSIKDGTLSTGCVEKSAAILCAAPWSGCGVSSFSGRRWEPRQVGLKRPRSSALGDGPVDIGAAADADRRALHQRREADCLDALDLRRHQRDDIRRIGLHVAGLVPYPEVDEDMLVRQDRPELSALLGPSVVISCAIGDSSLGRATWHGSRCFARWRPRSLPRLDCYSLTPASASSAASRAAQGYCRAFRSALSWQARSSRATPPPGAC